MARDAFLERVRQATQAGRAFRVAPHGDVTETTGYVGGGDDLCATFAAEANAVGGRARVVADFDAARLVLADWLRERRPASALVWRHEVLAKLRLADLLAELGVAELDHDTLSAMPPEARRTTTLAADVGITSADFAIAETGTLVMLARPGQERLSSLAPPCHIAVIERRQILPDLFDLFAALDDAGHDKLPSNLTLITGPSKTGDIELQLTTGVHGPGDWRVVVVDS
ncbi:MAG: lactate utilization protein [Pirellulales bacterium]